MRSYALAGAVLLLVIPFSHSLYTRITTYDLMKCSYGERGSLTATCINATSQYFKNTPYRFDHLDETLRCVNCTLQTLETGSFDISGNQIKNLDLSNSLIEQIRTKAFVGLIFLQQLILSNNNIKSIYPQTFSGVKKITYVDLGNNSISILSDDGFLELISLERLNLKNNHIKSIAQSAFKGLVHLHELDLSYNEISDVKDVFNNLTALKLLDLSYNKISVLTAKEFDNLTALLEVRFGHNHITSIPESEFCVMSSLRRLDLSYNAIDRVIAGSFKGLSALEDLDLSYNNIMEIPQKTLQSLHNLQYLNVSHNLLKIFQTGLYTGLPQLRVLNFSSNVMEDIEITGVFSLDSLDTLDFSRNNISYIDYVRLISRLPKISYLNLEDNFLSCGLEQEMENYFAEDNFKFILYSNKLGSVKCVENGPTPQPKHYIRKDSLVVEEVEKSGNGVHVWAFVLIAVTLVLVCVLYYLQLRTYQEMRALSVRPNRTTSEVQLISSDLEARDNDFLKE
ncbi:hypothetical protein Zmor_007911 [Zophobas morio]|uniref:Insulin-like growth factor-binding protein complex acid labile subunit n=1 Tax=Zophobas morio TaxID=2755281 RepID=A0AA38MML0_9CUCU|nr:hypothetical protein Zmor_007911 [Zophobas morio]